MSDGKIFAVVALWALTLGGCSEEPTEVNALVAALPLGNVIVRDSTIFPTASTAFKQFIPLDGRLNLIGHTGGYDALAAITFYSSYFPIRDTALVYSDTLKLHFVSWFPGPAGQLAFNVYRIARSWDPAVITWDTVQIGFYDQSVVRGTKSTTVGFGPDTQVVSVVLDTAMVRQWLATPTSTTDTKYGILLVPSSGCTVVGGFTAFDSDSTNLQPQLVVIAGSPSPTGPRDTTIYYSGIDTFVGNIDNLNSNPQLIYLQSGVDYRAAMNFDVSFIPRGAVINSAELILQRDPSTSRLTKYTTDTAFSIQASLSATDRTVLDAGLTFGRRKAGSGNTFSGDARRPVQLWLRGLNYGLTLRPYTLFEYSSFDLLTFYNDQAAVAANRPRLKIIYTTPR